MDPMIDTTTADDVYQCLEESLDRFSVDWNQAVSLATDGAPQMISKKVGDSTKLKEKLQQLNIICHGTTLMYEWLMLAQCIKHKLRVFTLLSMLEFFKFCRPVRGALLEFYPARHGK
ncbi:hypothetical protein RF11_15696 [Thelohanellus kitauei]|uniref:Uncharacterized protein n=1 Tax=Thelohanellus kitauei TaxID=669202 RepID=A0A0C2N0L3_THEKT|nr:hypothetical protein RF11_15696 [Thelohanellus kitauei]